MAAQDKVTFKQDLTEPVKIRHYEGVVFTGDDCGNIIKVALFDGGVPYSGGGTVSATAILADGTTFPLTQGVITDNMVSVPLEAGALAVSGLMGLYVKISGDGIICTVLNAIFTVQATDTGMVPAAMVTTVNELVAAIRDAQDSIPADLTNLLAAVAPTFSTATAYSAGAYVWQGGKLYRFTAAHPSGTWTGTDAVEVALGNDIADLKSALAEYGIDTIYQGAFDRTKSTANNAKYYYITTVHDDCKLKLITYAGESGLPKLIVVRNNVIVAIQNLTTSDGTYKTVDLDIDCMAGDMLFIGGTNKSFYFKTVSSGEKEKEFPNTNISIGNTVTITENNVYFQMDVSIFALSSGVLTDEISAIKEDIGDVKTLDNLYPDLEVRNGVYVNSQGEYETNVNWNTVIGIPYANDITITFAAENNNEVLFYCVRDSEGTKLEQAYTASGLSEYTFTTPFANAASIDISFRKELTNIRIYTSTTTIHSVLSELVDQSGRINDIGNYTLSIDSNALKYVETDSEIEYFGRWFDRVVGSDTVQAANTDGAEILFSVIGATYVTLTFDTWKKETGNEPYIVYSVDGAEFTRAQIISAVTIALPDTHWHSVRVMLDGMPEKITDQSAHKWNGTLWVCLKSYESDGTMKGLLPANRVGVFFGDSVTEGVCCLGNTTSSANNSASHAYPYYCAKKLNAVPFYVGYGASGLLNNGSFHPCIDAVDYDYNGVPAEYVKADFVVVNHGINDYSQTADAFGTAYETLIAAIKRKFPDVPIFMVRGFSDNLSKFAGTMQSIANANNKVYYIDTNGWSGATTDGTHLSPAGAQNNGEKLADKIIEVLGKAFFE